MKEPTKHREKAKPRMKGIYGRDIMKEWIYRIISNGKQGFEALMMLFRKMTAEVIIREETLYIGIFLNSN